MLDEEVSEAEYRDVEELFDISSFSARMTAALNLAGPEDLVHAVPEGDAQQPDGDTSYGEGSFSAVLSRHGKYLAEDFNRHFTKGKYDDALRVGTEILRRRQPVDVLIGMAEIRASRGDVDEACQLLSAAAIAGGDRARVWSEVARVAEKLGSRGRSIRQLARKESLRIQLGNRSGRLLKLD
ncbi:hypothetical protein ACGFYV_27480 [Streptomyces sp. NPDC048297]|uniref:hypothetical protein n=1 Tax=Streptomyces sp. NPDC048297 TaxID=3365531 RepID=UPI003713C862